MTTIIATKDKILSDGKVTVGGRVDSLNFCKVRNIGNYLVGGAGRATSVVKFFDWWNHKVSVDQANAFDPNLGITVLPDERDEDFQAIVVTPMGEMYIYEGNDITRALPIEEDFYSIGSGSDYALAALHAGATPEDAMEVAKRLDCYSGGTTFIESHTVWEDLPETREQAEGYTKEQLIDLMFGKEDLSEEGEQSVDVIDQEIKKVLEGKSVEFENTSSPIHIQSFPLSPEDNTKEWEICNHVYEFDMTFGLLSSPVKYKGVCGKCGHTVYKNYAEIESIAKDFEFRQLQDVQNRGFEISGTQGTDLEDNTSYTEEQLEMIMQGWSVNNGTPPVEEWVKVHYILKDGTSSFIPTNCLCWSLDETELDVRNQIAYWKLADE